MDRNNTDQPKMTLGFIDYMVQPMFTSLKKIIPEVNPFVETLFKNRAIWVERSENEIITVESVLEDYKRSTSPSNYEISSSANDSHYSSSSEDLGDGMKEIGSPPEKIHRKKNVSGGNSHSPTSGTSGKEQPAKSPSFGNKTKPSTLKHAQTVEFEPQVLKLANDKRKRSNLPNISKG